MKIIIDTREQTPYSFDTYPCQIERATLKTGDYSLEGLEDRVCIERKSLPDLFNTLGQGRKRFKREFERMQEMESAALVIECDSFHDIYIYGKRHAELIRKHHPKARPITAKSVWHTMLFWCIGYKIPFVFVGLNRDFAEKNVFLILERWHNRYMKF